MFVRNIWPPEEMDRINQSEGDQMHVECRRKETLHLRSTNCVKYQNCHKPRVLLYAVNRYISREQNTVYLMDLSE